MAEEKEGLFIAEFSFDCGIVVTCHQNTLMTRANSSLPVKRYEAKSDRGEVTTIIRDAFFRLFFLQHHQLVILVFFFFFFSFFLPPSFGIVSIFCLRVHMFRYWTRTSFEYEF